MTLNPKKFFIENTNYEEKNIMSIKKIHNGFTNESFLVCTNDKKKWQVRFAGLNEVVIRKNEFEVLKLINIKNHYYDENGNSIREWINGKNLSLFLNKKKKFKLICEKINELHSINIINSEIIINDYFLYLDKAKNLNIEIKKKYIELVNKYSNLNKVLSHNDLSPANIIYDGDKITFIDYEWSRINDNYFDIANFIRESNINLKWLSFFSKNLNNIDLLILRDYIFIVTCFAYQWTFLLDDTTIKVRKYRKKCLKKMNKIYKKILYNNFG